MVPSSCRARSRHNRSPCAAARSAARANARSAASRSRCRATRPITSRASHATSGWTLCPWPPSAARSAARASRSASSRRPRPAATCAAQASIWAVSAPADSRATSMLAAASAHRAPAIAARAIPRCRCAARGDGGPSRASSIRPVSIARSTCPDMAKTSVSASSTLVRSAGPTRSRARVSVCSALASAPTARSRRPASSSSAPARAASPARPARSAASVHHAPGRPGWAASAAASARPASMVRSGGSSPASTASWVSACRNRKPSRSATTSCRPTPSRSAATTAASARPVTGPSSVQSKRRPSTAAAPMTWRDSALMPSSRRRTASANVAGTPGALRSAACQRPSRSVSAPSPTSPARTSSTRNGMPSARPATNACTASGRSAASRQARVMSAIAAGSEAAERQHGGGPARRERAGQRGGFAAFLDPAREGGEAQHPFGGQVVGEVLEQRQRLLVGPVQVLQDEHAAGLRGQGAQQPQYRLAEEDRRLLPRHRLRRPPLGNQPPQHRAGTGRVPRWPAGAPLARPRSAPRRTAGTAWARRRPRPGRPGRSGRSRAAVRAISRTSRDLPMTGLAGQEHRAAAARPGRRQGGPQPAGFLVPPDQDRAQHLRHRISIGPAAAARPS